MGVILTTAVAYIELKGKVKYLEKLIGANSTSLASQENEIKHLSKVSNDVSEIKTNFVWLKESLVRIEKELTSGRNNYQ